MKKKVVVLALASILVLAFQAYALADPVDVTVGVTAATPSITNVSLEDASNSPVTVLDVNTEYHLHFTVIHRNSLWATQYVRVDLSNSPGTTSARDFYRFQINTLLNLAPTWTCPTGAYFLGDPSLTGYNPFSDRHSFELHFRLDKIARPTGATRNWVAEIRAQGLTYFVTHSSTTYDVNKYDEISAQTTSIDFGTVNPGTALTRQNVNVTIISNTEVDVRVQGQELSTGAPNNFTIPEDSFDMQRDDGTPATPIALTTAYQSIYTSLFGTADAVGGILGYNNGNTRAVSFGGTIPDPQPEGTYTGTWQLVLFTGNVTPS